MNTEHQAALLEMFQLYGHETLSAAINQRHYEDIAEQVKAEVAAQKQARDAVPKVGDIYYDGRYFRVITRLMNKTYEYETVSYTIDNSNVIDKGLISVRGTYTVAPLVERVLDTKLKDKLCRLEQMTKYTGTPIVKAVAQFLD